MAHPSLFLASRAVSLLDPASDAVVAGVVGRAWCALDRPPADGRAGQPDRPGRPLSPGAARSSATSTSLLGWLRLLGLTRAEVAARTSIDGLGPLVAASRESRGTVLVAAHVGEWEWGAAALAAAGLPVVAVAGVQMRADWTPALRRAKERLGIDVVGPDASPVRLARALRKGRRRRPAGRRRRRHRDRPRRRRRPPHRPAARAGAPGRALRCAPRGRTVPRATRPIPRATW